MKKRVFVSLLVLLGLLPLIGMYGQGFTGPNAVANPAQVHTVNAVQAKSLPDNSLVKMTGVLAQSLSREKFLFRDSSGDIVVEIDRELWTLLGLSVGAEDRVEIGGKLDVERRGVEVEVKTLRKI